MPILVGLVSAGLVGPGLVGDIPVCVEIVGVVGVKVVDGIVDIELELVDGVIAVEAKLVEGLTLGEGIVLVSVELPGPLVDGLPTALLDPLEPIGFDPVWPDARVEENGDGPGDTDDPPDETVPPALVAVLGLVRRIDVVDDRDLTLVTVDVDGGPIGDEKPPMPGLENTPELGTHGTLGFVICTGGLVGFDTPP